MYANCNGLNMQAKFPHVFFFFFFFFFGRGGGREGVERREGCVEDRSYLSKRYCKTRKENSQGTDSIQSQISFKTSREKKDSTK